MQTLRKPAFLFGMLALLVFFIGLALKTREFEYSSYIMYSSFVLGGIFWMWSIIDVIGADHLKRFQKSFWLILVVAVPMFGGLLYFIMHNQKNTIAG